MKWAVLTEECGGDRNGNRLRIVLIRADPARRVRVAVFTVSPILFNSMSLLPFLIWIVAHGSFRPRRMAARSNAGFVNVTPG